MPAEDVVDIVAGTPEDVDAAMEIVETAIGAKYVDGVRKRLEQGLKWFLIAKAGPRMEPCAVLLADPDDALGAYLVAVGVLPDHQSQGLGRRLMHAWHKGMAREGVRQVELDVRDDNPEARRFYESLGYNTVGVREGLYEDNVDGWLLRRMLP